eukprot:1833774-Pleurochrysis_carterae.AAC.1
MVVKASATTRADACGRRQLLLHPRQWRSGVAVSAGARRLGLLHASAGAGDLGSDGGRHRYDKGDGTRGEEARGGGNGVGALAREGFGDRVRVDGGTLANRS